VIGPVDSFSTSDAPLTGCHPCFAARILDSFVLANRQDPLEVDCFDACPTPARGSVCQSNPFFLSPRLTFSLQVTALLSNIPPPANPMVYNLPPRNPGPSTTHALSPSFPVPHIPNRLPTPPPVPQSLVRQRSPQAVVCTTLSERSLVLQIFRALHPSNAACGSDDLQAERRNLQSWWVSFLYIIYVSPSLMPFDPRLTTLTTMRHLLLSFPHFVLALISFRLPPLFTGKPRFAILCQRQ
jgi:hypothetical protein